MSELNKIRKPLEMRRCLYKPGIIAFALAIPFSIKHVQADSAPERSMLAFKYLDYQDRQPGLERIAVRASSVQLLVPLNEEWSFDASRTVDTVSGASPSYHSEPSSAKKMDDIRRASDVKVSHYLPQGSVSLGVAASKESDYDSRVYSVNGSLSTEDKNSTLHLGLASTSDKINPSNQIVIGEKKHIIDMMIGLTQVITSQDIVQLNISHSKGHGYYSDPYKFFDNRPRKKIINSALLRWNHHVEATDGVSRLGYRYYKDSFGVRSNTLTAEYVQPLPYGWTITPLARLYSQTAASFYYDPVNPPDPTIPDNFQPAITLLSEDQRLAAFGARSLGFKVSKLIYKDLLLDFKYENYQQRSQWCFNCSGSPGIAAFKASIFQVGLSYFF